ncbi:MAG: methyltransferase domain-containing protein [Nitrospira sp.]|nr:methyltransferase domain-containing protein [Nitrospira sp.]
MIHLDNCQICGHNRFLLWHKIKEWSFARCEGCGFIFLNPRPPIDYFKEFYDPLSQYDYKVEGVEYIKKEADFISAYHQQFEVIETVAQKGSLLEIGSACGYFLETARQRAWNPYGVELSTGGANYCEQRFGIKVFNGDVLDAGLPANFFDLVVTIHTLEHVYNPATLVKECGRITKPGGIFIVEVPYIPDENDRSAVNPADLPAHLSLFTKRTLGDVLVRYGFTVIRTENNEKDCIIRMTAEKQGLSIVRRMFRQLKNTVMPQLHWLALLLRTLRSHLGNAVVTSEARPKGIPGLDEYAYQTHSPPRNSMPERSLKFAKREGGRYAWHQFGNYIPPLYSFLTDEEWNILEGWYDDTEKEKLLRECNIPFLSVVQGFIMGSVIDRIVQLGHFAGYSTLLIGFMMRKMQKKRTFLTIDISRRCCDYTRKWVEIAKIEEYVSIELGDSADPKMIAKAEELFQAPPKAIVLDSSHQYEHTMSELRLWYPALDNGGFIFLHDSGEYAKEFDSTKKGGVHVAMQEWLAQTREARAINIYPPAHTYADPIYKDPCGLGIIQKL